MFHLNCFNDVINIDTFINEKTINIKLFINKYIFTDSDYNNRKYFFYFKTGTRFSMKIYSNKVSKCCHSITVISNKTQ